MTQHDIPSYAGAGSRNLDALRAFACEIGIDQSRIDACADEPTLFGLVIEAMLLERGTTSLDDAAQRSNISPALARRVWRAFGNLDGRSLNEDEVAILDFLSAVQTIVGVDATTEFAWEIGSRMDQLAETIVSRFEFDMGYPRGADGTPRAELAAFFKDVIDEMLPQLTKALDVVLRQRFASIVPADWPSSDPFVPLDSIAVVAVRFTRTPDELGRLIDSLPAQLDEAMRFHGGRFVRFIAEGALLTVPERDDACRAAMQIVQLDQLCDTAIAVAWGPVSVRERNVFGPVVSTARRLVREAKAGEVLVTGDVAERTPRSDDLRFASTDSEVFVGIDGSAPVFRLLR